MKMDISIASSQSLLRKFKAGFPDYPHIRKEGAGIRVDLTNATGRRWLESTVDDDAGLQGTVFAKSKLGINRFKVQIDAPVTVAQVAQILEWLESKSTKSPPFTTQDSPKNTVRAYSRKTK